MPKQKNPTMKQAGARHERGLSLIELMISLLISTLILAGLTQVFTTNRATYQSDEGLARLQENARFAMDFLVRDIRRAGSMGCLSVPVLRGLNNGVQGPDDISPHNVTGSPLNLDLSPIKGFDATAIAAAATSYTLPTLYPPPLTTATNPAMDATLAPPGGIVAGSDAILLSSMDQDSVRLMAKPTPNQLFVPNTTLIDTGQIILAADCGKASVLTKVLSKSTSGGVTTLTVNPSSKLGEIIENEVQVGALRTVVYYIGQGSNNGPSLFSRNFSDGIGTPQELVEGVENMQLLYGIDSACTPGNTRGTACTYQPAALVNPQQIVSVRIALLIATSNVASARDSGAANLGGSTETGFDTNQYTMQGITFTPNPDHRRRRAFETTVAVRSLSVAK